MRLKTVTSRRQRKMLMKMGMKVASLLNQESQALASSLQIKQVQYMYLTCSACYILFTLPTVLSCITFVS